jgi:pullulanase/glycogen debranching enzyme
MLPALGQGNLLTLLFRVSDEFLDTQLGNNNPSNQDNEISWLDWSLLRASQDAFRFFEGVVAYWHEPSFYKLIRRRHRGKRLPARQKFLMQRIAIQ